MSTDSIERETVIAAPVERVWELLTDARHVGAWFSERAEIDLRPGGAMVMHWDAHGTYTARIERIEPPRRLSFRWATDSPGEEPTAGNSTLVEYTLTPEGEDTRLRVVESGFAELAFDEDGRRSYREKNVDGWAGMMASIAGYAEGARAS